MDRTIEVLENYGFVNPEVIQEAIAKLPADRIYALTEELKAALRTELDVFEPETALTPFNFLASASLRGDTGCFGLRCRLGKTRAIARYAGLFCDRVVLPLRLHLGHRDDTVQDYRDSILRAVLTILEMRPLIEVGIVQLVSELDFCPQCRPDRIPSTPEIVAAAAKIKSQNFSRFSLSKETKGDEVRLVLRGPEEYLEHGMLLYRKARFPFVDLPDGILSEELLEKSKLVDGIFNRIIRDVVLQQLYGVHFQSQYLTDLPGEAELLMALHEEDQLAARTAALCARLSHRVPLLSEIPLEHILKIRKEDHAVFENYRVALQKIIKDYLTGKASVGDSEARDLFSDVLEPEIRKMEVQAKSERRSALKKSGVKIAATSAAVALGVYSGLVPQQWMEIFKIVGGAAFVRDVAESVATLSDRSSVRNHNLFFLLRLKEEGGYR